jgi:glycosyltransferase involved in cell wall biosynthesis
VRPLRLAAMIRPDSLVRQPVLTMRVLRELGRRHGEALEIVLFGCRSDDPGFLDLPRDFAWSHAGLLTPQQMAALYNEVDLFADLSLYQALGLSSLEAMASGVAVVAPRYGGSGEFVRDGENGLLVDTGDVVAASLALSRLVDDAALRRRLAAQALRDAAPYHPEGAALRLLAALWG